MWPGTPRLTERWVRTYTRGLPADVAQTRRLELASDIYEQMSESAATLGARAVRLAVVGRTARGVVDDLAWRHEQRQTMKQSESSVHPTALRAAWGAATQAWFAPAAVLCGLFNLVLGVGILFDTGSTMPGRVVGPMFLLAFAASMAVGLHMRSLAGRPARVPTHASEVAVTGSRVAIAGRYLVVLVAIASIALAVTGSRLGMLAAALALLTLAAGIPSWRRSRTAGAAAARSSSLAVADGLILFATLPGFAFFWIVVPAVLALITVVGVLGTAPGLRARAAA
jgi:hypothetical protein